ncbi:unnamed protein product [Mytilus edulis]|uniref:HMCN n=1 Tax=Mytilus edulis TaxID=6550 RepID=A0A8S3PW13_MYTED|nr:unnamed protein product [Mytilus edulis]
MMKGMMEGMKSSMGGMMTGAEKMACYSTCGVCDCGGNCFDRQPCKLCKDLLCSNNQISYQITDKTTTKATIAPSTMFTSPSTADTQSPITVTQKGYVNIDTGRIENNCETRTKDVKTRRFILGDLGLGVLTMASAASCYISCSSCSCETVGTTQQHCWDVLPCKPCKELVCYKNKTEISTSPPTTTVIDHCNSSPCQNEGECRNKADSYKCFCKTKYTPTHYEIYIGLNCDVGFKYNFSHQTTHIPQTAVNTDTPTTNGPLWTTFKQALGTNNNDPCRSSPCLNGGLCVNKSHTFSCYCQSSPHGSIITTGNRCELQIDLSKSQNIHHFRFAETINFPAEEDISADSARFSDISLYLTNEANDINAENIGIVQMPEEQNLSLSNSNSDTTEHLNSGYEHPYTTLVVNNESSKVQYSYYTVGQTVLLKCTDGAVHLHSAVWAGPAQNSIRKRTPVSIIDMNALPSNMTFANVTKEKILHGKENTTLHIICSVQDGIPDSLSIKRNNNTVKSGEDSSLEYILLPTRLDHGVKYTCEARSSLLKQPLKEIIHLDIKYRPLVSSNHDGIQEIKKGTSHTLCCYVDSNPIPTSTRWMNGSQEILVTHNVTETCFILRNVSQYDQGNYTCIAYNIVGNGSVTIDIQVNSYTSSVKKSLLFPGIIILVLMITIAVITPGIALIVHYKKQMHKKRTVPTKHIQKPEGSENESADTTEITNGLNLHTTSQENNNPVILAVTRIGVRNKVTAMVSVEHASTSLDNGSNVSENVDDEYEHPYNTLIADNRAKDELTYVTIKWNSNYENSHPTENAACRRFIDKNFHKIKKFKLLKIE